MEQLTLKPGQASGGLPDRFDMLRPDRADAVRAVCTSYRALVALAPLLHRKLVFVAPAVQDRAGLLRLFASRAAPLVAEASGGRFGAETLLAMLEARENLQSTVLTEGIAFPHAIGDGLTPSLVGAARLAPALVYDSAHPPIELCFALFGDAATPTVHVRTLARLARIVSDPEARRRLLSARTPRELLDGLREQDASLHA